MTELVLFTLAAVQVTVLVVSWVLDRALLRWPDEAKAMRARLLRR